MSSTTVHGVCRGAPGRRCSKRTFLTLPGRLCWKCIEYMQAQLLAALDEMDKGDE
jgi:hypothetical protein